MGHKSLSAIMYFIELEIKLVAYLGFVNYRHRVKASTHTRFLNVAFSDRHCDSASSVCFPKVAVARHRRETDMPVRPNFVSCMAFKSFGLDSR